MIKIGFIFGGKSTEHEISVITACQAMNFINTEKYEVVPIFVDKELNFYSSPILKDVEIYKEMNLVKSYAKEVGISKDKNGVFIYNKKSFFKSKISYIDIFFPIGHGAFLEDGKLQGMLEMYEIPVVGPASFAAAIGQDKILQKSVYKDAGIKVVDSFWFYDEAYKKDDKEILKQAKELGYPVIVKPATLGSSIGIKVAFDEDEFKEAVSQAMTYDKKILVEKTIENFREVNIAVLGNYKEQQVSAIEEVFTSGDRILSYQDKYQGGSKGSKMGSKGGNGAKGMASLLRQVPVDLTSKEVDSIAEMAMKAHSALGLSGVARFDFILKGKTIYLNEVNTIPGSLSYYLFEPIGMDFTELLERLIKIAIKEYQDKDNYVYSFDTNILKNYKAGSKNGKIK